MSLLGSVGSGLRSMLGMVPLWVYATLALAVFLLIWNGPILAAIGAVGMLALAKKFGWG